MVLLVGLFFVSGCELQNLPTSAPVPVSKVKEPTLATGGRFGLLAAPGKDNEQLHVGDSADQVDSLFKSPKSASTFQTLPPGFESPYSAEGFDFEGAGFGVIYYDAKVALAMKTYSAQTDQQTLALEGAYEDAFGRPDPKEVLPGTKVRYWFWEDPDKDQRFMICAVASKTEPTKFDVTTAVGDIVVMNANTLRMSPLLARNDRQAMEPPLNTKVFPH